MRKLSEEYIAYSKYRFEKAGDDLRSAKALYDIGEYASANNRSYYSIFHSIRAVLALDTFDSKKHGIVIGEFRRRYIKTNIFPTDISDMIGSAFEIRTQSDYEDMYIASKGETEEQIKNAEYVLSVIEKHLKNEGILESV